MTKEEAAIALNESEYRDEGSKELFTAMKAAGLVAVFGSSDDLMEFRGAIYDEVGAYDGTTAFVDPEGLIPARDQIEGDDELKEFFRRKPRGIAINALWCAEEGYSWTFATDIPHSTFEVVEDGDPYCRGIVFALADAQGIEASGQDANAA